MTSQRGPIGVALVGYGYWGTNLARNLASAKSLELLTIADASPDRRLAASAAHPRVAVVDGFEPAFSDDIEAIVLATPAGTHAELAVAALRAGRHVLVEKPLALDVQGALAVVAEADSSGLTAMVGHTFLYSPPVNWLRDAIVRGDLGAPQYLYSQRLNLGRIRRDCNALWNFGPHDVSIMMHLLDETPTEVSARGFSFLQPGIDDVCFASLVFPSGVGANLHVSWIDPRKTRLMTVVGDEKMAVLNDVSTDQKLWIFDAGVAREGVASSMGRYSNMAEFQWQTRAGDITIPKIAMQEPLLLEVEAFGAACQAGSTPVTSARHGLDVVRVLVAMEESAGQGGSPVAVEA